MFRYLTPAATRGADRSFTPGLRIALLTSVVLFASLAAISTPSTAAVTDSEELGKFGSEGAGAAQLLIPRGMASDPLTGHLYVADTGNRRIDEFTAWGEFVKAWGWGVKDGSAELQVCGPAAPEASPPPSLCRAGIAGAGKGQFGAGSPFSVVVGASGDVYVLDNGNRRLQKFTSTGQFVWMVGGNVNKTKVGEVGSTPAQRNLCTEASGDECQAGSVGAGQGEFSEGIGLTISQSGTLLVGSEGRIEEFGADGSFLGEFSVGGTVDAIAPDPTNSDLYVLYRGEEDVHKLSSSGTELGSLKVREPQAIAADPVSGDLYAARPQFADTRPEVVEFNPSGIEVSSCCTPAPLPGEPDTRAALRFSLTGLGTNTAGDLYTANRSNDKGNYITFYGPPPLKWPPPPQPPEIVSQFSTTVDSTSATLKAQINPNFWADTRLYLEYGPADCASNPCTQQPGAPGIELGAGAVKKAVTSSGVVLTGLTPGMTYHYRFVAESSGGGPVRGVGGKVGADGAEGTFTTFAASQAPAPCPNDAFRTGPSASLPDCRAYEMVSPVDKNNGDIKSLRDLPSFETHLYQASVDGEALTYSSYRAFGGAEGDPYTSQYLARRDGAGWNSEALGGALGLTFYGSALLEDEFKAFSPDLCHSWLVPGGESTLAPGEVAGFPNLYRRDNCPKGYEALTTVEPPSPRIPADYYPEPQGFSVDGSKAIFRVRDKLTEDARAAAFQVYEASGGALKAVCVFPEGTSTKVEGEFPNCSAGTSGETPLQSEIGRTASVSHAMSEDGSRIYWSASAEEQKPGRLYLRVNGDTTLKVSEAPGEGQTTKPVRFWGASADGAEALYVVEDPDQKNPSPKDKNLYLYDLGAEESALIAPKVNAVVAASEDLSRVYFLSKAVLAGASGASAGKDNLYLYEEGADTFIATLSEKDVGDVGEASSGAGTLVTSDGSITPIFHVARATPDGAHLAFVSTEPLSGFDNRDAASGEADSEVFSYDAVSGKLACASCSPAGARPAGRNIKGQGNTGFLWTAASLPSPQTQLNTRRALSEDGSKLFFTSYLDLLPADTNGKADVYEWEAIGSGSCKGEADPDYYPLNGGCLFLISSGESPSDSELVDTAANGRDVFFTTNASLLPQDPGLIDIYDAREGGGFPAPQGQPAPCEGEACQGPISPPNDPTPASSSFQGAGNQVKSKAKKHKHKARKRKQRQAKKRAQRAAKHNRRNAR